MLFFDPWMRILCNMCDHCIYNCIPLLNAFEIDIRVLRGWAGTRTLGWLSGREGPFLTELGLSGYS